MLRRRSRQTKFSHENLVEKFKISVQDFVHIRTAQNLLLLSSFVIYLLFLTLLGLHVCLLIISLIIFFFNFFV